MTLKVQRLLDYKSTKKIFSRGQPYKNQTVVQWLYPYLIYKKEEEGCFKTKNSGAHLSSMSELDC